MTRQIPLINDLMADLAALPTEVVGSHLSDEALFDYIMGRVSVSQTQQIDLHLASCAVCAEEADLLVDASLPWQGAAGERRLAALRERVLGKQKKQSEQPSLQERLKQALEGMVASWQGAFQARQPLAADTQGKKRRRIWEYQSADGRLRGVAVLDWRGDVTFRFTSKDMALAGTGFVLRWGKCTREVALRQVSATEARAKEVILSHERPDELSTPVEFSIAE